MSGVVAEIKTVLESARGNVARQVNSELLHTYWTIGRIITEYEQTVPERADYGKQTLRELSRALTAEIGKGFSVSNLQFMRRFYQTYQIQQTLSVKAPPHNSRHASRPQLIPAYFTKMLANTQSIGCAFCFICRKI